MYSSFSTLEEGGESRIGIPKLQEKLAGVERNSQERVTVNPSRVGNRRIR
ncbi:hypothetical protein N665_3230s0001 [Sinapis alba]|nr:hypothetical protein N665_3230s0001 [Sinapis alba]